MRLIIYIIGLCFLSNTLIAQKNIEFSKANFKSNPAGFKTAMKHFNEGDATYFA